MPDQIDFRQVVHALSDAIDLVGVDEVHHGKRVAVMAVECGKKLGLSAALTDRLYHAALLHDCGVSSTTVHRYLVTELDWAGADEHCLFGHNLLKTHELFADLALLVRYHHTHWNKLTGINIDQETALINNCIYLVDRVDTLIAKYDIEELLYYKDDIRNTIAKYRDIFFAPQLVDVFMKISTSEYFWLNLQPRHLELYLNKMAKDRQIRHIDHGCFLRIARMFATIVDAKSQFTVDHSLGVSRLARHIGELLALPRKSCEELEVAGLLHDLGKLRVPDEILEKPGPLTGMERATIKHHSFESYQILRRIDGFEAIAEMAAFHHETLSGEGYPFHRQATNLSREARIIAVADVFQALVQNRPYRDSMSAEESMDVLQKMVADDKLDPDIVKTVQDNLESCRLAATGMDPTQAQGAITGGESHLSAAKQSFYRLQQF